MADEDAEKVGYLEENEKKEREEEEWSGDEEKGSRFEIVKDFGGELLSGEGDLLAYEELYFVEDSPTDANDAAFSWG